MERQGMTGVAVQEKEAQSRVTWEIGAPRASLIILSHNNGQFLRDLVNSIFNTTDYADYSLIIVDNRSTEGDLLEFYEELKSNPRVKLVHYDEPFNYSKAINIGVEHSDGEVVVLLNNDMLVTDSTWLRELVQWAVHPQIGVVGGKLLHRNLSIQHTGIILGMNGILGHLYLNAPEHYHGLAGSADWYRNFYALTGACQAIRRELFHQVGGYDERFRLAFGDIDFCLRVAKAGYRNLYNPFARLIHFEGGSRGYETPAKDIQLGYAELMPWLEQDDPYFSPSLTYEPIPQCVLSEEGLNARMINIEKRRKSISSYFESNSEE
jgi:GT2 family glycosyltransferase